MNSQLHRNELFFAIAFPYAGEPALNTDYLWPTAYIVAYPCKGVGQWRAMATWGNEDVLIADSCYELARMIRAHYKPETTGYSNFIKLRRVDHAAMGLYGQRRSSQLP